MSTCRTYSWWAISSLMGVGLRITFYTVWRIEEGEVEERGVSDVKRGSKGERISFWVKRRGRRYEIRKKIRGFGSESRGFVSISQMREREK